MFKRIFVFLGCMDVLIGNEMILYQNISITTKIEPTLLMANPQINESEKLRTEKNLSIIQKNQIIQTFNLLNQEMEKYGICHGGGFDIAPYYAYNNGSKKQIGYQTHWSVACEFDKNSLETFNRYLNVIQDQIAKNPYLVFTLPSIYKSVDENQNNQLDEELNIALIQKSQDIAKQYAKVLRKKCEIKEITLGKVQESIAPVFALAKSVDAKLNANENLESIIAPSAKEQNKILEAKVIYRCY